MQNINFKIKGTHCKGCKTLIENEVNNIKGINDFHFNITSEIATLKVKEHKTKDKVFTIIKNLGYFPSENDGKGTKQKIGSQFKSIFLGLFLLTFFIIGYYLIQYFGGYEILAELNNNNVSYSLILLIGILASFHCVGMCGGLVVSYTIINEESSQKKSNKRHFQYNFGRLISYTIIGGILGGFGSFFGVNPTISGALLLFVGFFMILMGLSISTNNKWLRRITHKLSSFEFIAKYLYKNKTSKKPKGPFFIGLLTGLMPCGPLQAMQLYALSTGSIFDGALSMFIYALGTIPLMFGFGSIISLLNKNKIKKIIKFSGIVVVILGIIMANRGLANFGIGFNSLLPTTPEAKIDNDRNIQIIEMDVSYSGYKPNIIYIKKDVPVRWIIKDKGITGCTNEIFLYHENGIIKKKLNQKETIIEFTPTKLGELKFSCWMRMVWGKFIVTKDGEKQLQNFIDKTPEVSASETKSCDGSCGGGCGSPTTKSSCGCSQ